MTKTRKSDNCKTALCLGHTDEAINYATGKLLGYVGFHEVDSYVPIWELHEKIEDVANKLGIDIACLRTGKGYHFVSFGIMPKSKREEFAKTMQKMFPSDYLRNPKHRVLRLGKKGSHMKPKFLYFYARLHSTKQNRHLSSSHMKTYVNEGIIPKKVIEGLIKYNGGNVRRTSETLCLYPAWIPKNMRAASLSKTEDSKGNPYRTKNSNRKGGQE